MLLFKSSLPSQGCFSLGVTRRDEGAPSIYPVNEIGALLASSKICGGAQLFLKGKKKKKSNQLCAEITYEHPIFFLATLTQGEGGAYRGYNAFPTTQLTGPGMCHKSWL